MVTSDIGFTITLSSFFQNTNRKSEFYTIKIIWCYIRGILLRLSGQSILIMAGGISEMIVNCIFNVAIFQKHIVKKLIFLFNIEYNSLLKTY